MTDSSKASGKRAKLLADRLIHGVNLLATFAEGLSESDWNKPVKGDGRTIGVVIHHVASMYPIEIELAQTIASGTPITGVSKNVVDQMNADHAIENAQVDKKQTLELLRQNGSHAATALREFTDEELDGSATISLYYDAPLTAQFFIEDHALRHSFHHLGKIKESI